MSAGLVNRRKQQRRRSSYGLWSGLRDRSAKIDYRRPAEPSEPSPSFPDLREPEPGEIRWLETNTIKLLNIMRMPPNLIVRQPNTMAKATTQKAKNTQPTPSNILRMLANTASKRTPKASSKSSYKGPAQVGPPFVETDPRNDLRLEERLLGSRVDRRVSVWPNAERT
jgi:hypothetical protein